MSEVLAAHEAGVAPARPSKPQVELDYVAGFDGLRALGLLVMLAYHHGVHAARGGIFTVSMFFTLSGYLIATLVLQEWVRYDRISLRRFWERRARRLLPAAVVTVVGVVVLQALFEVGSGDRFRGDVLAALGYVENWRLVASGGDYGAIFSLESPVQHYWSLAVEEQFYLAFPLLFVGAMALLRGRWGRVGLVFGVGAAAAYGAAWLTAAADGNSNLAYYASYTRASEVLTGVALAFVVVTAPVRRLLSHPVGIVAVRVGALVGLAVMAWLWHGVELTDPFVFRGGTALNAAATCLVILACTSPRPGRVARLLGVGPLRSLGRISYGVYLVHWPLFLWLDEERTGLGYRPLFALRVAVSIGVAVASYHLVEMPLRTRRVASPRRLVGLFAAPAVVATVLVVLVPVHASNVISLAAADEGDDPVRPGVVTARGAPARARVLLVGDSVSWTMWPGLVTWNARHPDRQVHVDAVMAMGCTVAEAGTIRFLGEEVRPWPDCVRFRERLTDALRTGDYDAVVVVMGHKDLGERRVEGRWRHFGDPRFDRWFRRQADGLAEVLAVEGVPVLWSSLPHARAVPAPTASWVDYGNNDPARADRLNEIVGAVVAGRPGFRVVDVAGWLRQRPGGEHNPDDRGDGVHWTFSGSDAVAAWLVPQILSQVA